MRLADPAYPRTLTLASPDIQDGVAWWRMVAPWNALRESIPGLGIMTLDLRTQPPQWTPIGFSRALIINRPYLPPHVSMVDTASASGVPSIVDFDDCLWDIPRWNQAHHQYGKPERESAQIAATRAYALTVSTPRLGRYIKTRIAPDADVRVVPNALPDWYTWANTLARRKLLIWRGGHSHIGDMIDHREEIAEVLRARPDWHLLTVGEDPWWLHEILPEGQSTHVPRQPLPVFHRWLRNSAAAVMMVPLRDCELNRCKSNISWMEGTLAGAAVLAPEWSEEFDRPGVVRYTDFGRDLAALLDMPQGERDALVAQSRAWIDDCGRHRHANVQRLMLLREVLDD